MCGWSSLDKTAGRHVDYAARFIFTPSFEGFEALFREVKFQSYLLNSIVVATTTTGPDRGRVAGPAAYALTQLRMRGRLFLASILVARMVPGIAIVIPIYLAASRLGLLDTYIVLITIYTAFNLPFAIWLLRGFFREVPGEVREAAIIDGAARSRSSPGSCCRSSRRASSRPAFSSSSPPGTNSSSLSL